jgi:hypothetical protein
MEEMFTESTIEDLKNKRLFEVQEIKTLIYGRCYTICYLRKVKLVDYFTMIQLKTTFDVTIYVHEKHEEFWVKLTSPPNHIFTSRLLVQSDTLGADLVLSEKRVKLLNKENAPCKSYSQNDNDEELLSFIDCLQHSISVNVGIKLICTLPFMTDFLLNTTLAQCSERPDSVKSYQIFSDFIQELIQKMSFYGCPSPCSSVTYNVVTKYFHKNIEFIFEAETKVENETFFYLSLFYDTLIIEKSIESYDYDWADFFIYTGGNLGLFLGFSCLSTLIAILRYTNSACIKK